jgi:hypothetical protein
MEKIFFYKTLKALLGLGLIIKGIEFIDMSYNTFQENNNYKPSPNISAFHYYVNPTEFLLPGLYILLIGMIFIYCVPFLLKILVGYSVVMPAYFLFYFVLFSIYDSSINIYLDFVDKMFVFLGMIFSTILICHFNNFDWRNQIINSYKIALIIGVLYAIINFYLGYPLT